MATPTAPAEVRYTITSRRNIHRPLGLDFDDVPVTDAPAITAVAAAALRNRVCDRRDEAADPTTWYAGDCGVWATVTDLHRRGDHDEACDLAEFLYWTEQRATARNLVVWTLGVVK